jgi:hypothetical protein
MVGTHCTLRQQDRGKDREQDEDRDNKDIKTVVSVVESDRDGDKDRVSVALSDRDRQHTLTQWPNLQKAVESLPSHWHRHNKLWRSLLCKT